MKYLLMTAVILFSTVAHAGGLGAGVAQGVLNGQAAAQQTQINDQWMEMSKAWTECVRQGGGASCGSPPQPPQQYQQPQYQAPQPQYKPQYDWSCMSICQNGKNAQQQIECQVPCRNR